MNWQQKLALGFFALLVGLMLGAAIANYGKPVTGNSAHLWHEGMNREGTI